MSDKPFKKHLSRVLSTKITQKDKMRNVIKWVLSWDLNYCCLQASLTKGCFG